MSDEAFNSPFFGLKKDLKGSKKAQKPAPPVAAQTKKAPPPAALSRDFAAEDAESSALFLAALGRSTSPVRQKEPGEEPGPSMAELFGEQRPAKNKAAQAKSNPAPRPEDAPDVPLDNDEAASFAQAMQGVKPVDESRGRALTPAAPAAPIRHQSVERDYLTEFTEGKYEFALEYTEEFFEGHVMGLDPLVIGKLRAGQYSPETHIDLHGLNSEQAYAALLDFIRNAYNQGRRHLVVVTGRGKNSPGGLSVLRQNMQEWLTHDPLRRVVLAFCTAQPKDGGAGALYVLLRKYKKKMGKVRWDITPPAV